MGVKISARFYSPIVLTNQEIKTNILSITNDGDTPIEFQPRNAYGGNQKTFTGINLEIPYGNGGSDLMSKNDVDKIRILSKTKGMDVSKIKDVASNNAGKVAWRIYPLENVVIDPNEPIIIKVHSVKTNSLAGAVKILLCIYNDNESELFGTDIEKIDPPEITMFSAEAVSEMVKGFIPLEMVANEENECFIQQPYMGPDVPPSAPNLFRVRWECKNSFSCELSYGNVISQIPFSGEKTLGVDKNIKTIKLTAYGKNRVGSVEKEIPLRNI